MTSNTADFLAGWFGGILTVLVNYPFDTVKVKQQAYHITIRAAIKNTYTSEGIIGFYRGMLSPLLIYGPTNSLFFGGYGYCMRLFSHSNVLEHNTSHTDYASMCRIFLAGTIGGTLQTLFYSPVEYIKIILQANSEVNTICKKKRYIPPYKNTYSAILGVYKTSGFLGYYKGFWPTLIRDGPSGGIYMLVYEIFRHSILKQTDSINMISKDMVAGGTAGLLSIVTVLPFDVVKTHIQTDDPKKPYYKGILDCFAKLYASDGIKIFFKGLPVTCYRSFPAHAVTFVGYEFILALLQ